MKHLSELRKRLSDAEIAYVSAKTSLDNSLEYIVCKEELKIARYNYGKACEKVISALLDNDEFICDSTKVTWYFEEVV